MTVEIEEGPVPHLLHTHLGLSMAACKRNPDEAKYIINAFRPALQFVSSILNPPPPHQDWHVPVINASW